MPQQQQPGQSAKIIKANYRLQHKVGAGPLDQNAVKASQNVIENNVVDFQPLGLALLKKLEDGIALASDPAVTMQQMKDVLTTPVMELKANAAIFHYTLITNLANIVLSFLEAIKIMDVDAINIVSAHSKTLHMIIVRQMSGDGGEAGKQLATELQQACDRYYHKRFAK